MRNAHEEWNTIAAEYDEKIVRGDFFRKKILDEAILKRLENIQDKAVLDLGCGQGYFSDLLSKRNARVTGIDISDKLISIAKTRYKNITFVTGSIENALPFNDHQFDIIFSNMVFMDVENLDETLREIKRVSKQNARIIISVLHPLFTSGKVYKTPLEYLLFKKPSFLLGGYKKSKTMSWNILHTTHTTTVFHRPTEWYINLLSEHDIKIVNIEACTLPASFAKNGFQKMLEDIPMFLILEGIINT